ncbi:MAG: hypothetical protein LUG86_06745 [Oscillospiraceae bacterium]|nr:hypothetical protein [Oscillospiraceae bacterium]
MEDGIVTMAYQKPVMEIVFFANDTAFCNTGNSGGYVKDDHTGWTGDY